MVSKGYFVYAVLAPYLCSLNMRLCSVVQVEMAAKMVQELLVPVDDDKNEHKQKQLKELVRHLHVLSVRYCTVCLCL